MKIKYLLICMSILTGWHQMLYASDEDKNPLHEENVVAYKNYKSPVPDRFPIVASSVFNSVKGPQPGDLDGVEACGFNMCMDMATPERFEKLLDYMKGKDLRLLIQGDPFVYYGPGINENWKSALPSFVRKFKDNPLVAGWKFYDEPKWNSLKEIKLRYDLLEKCDPGGFIYINLVGEIAKDFTGPCKTLPEYFDSVGGMFKMDVWSFDYYPIIIAQNKFHVNYERFYTALDVFAKKSRATATPMWSYLESMEYEMSSHSRPAATLSYLSFAAYSSLAYGAQGLVYWTYWQRPPSSEVNHLPALVDLEGNKMPAWYAAQKINLQVQALSKVFLGAYMEDCVHTGNIDMKGVKPSVGNFGPLESLTNQDKGVLVSHLKNGEHDYLLIVNHDVEKKQKVKMRFKRGKEILELSVGKSGEINAKNVGNSKNVSLMPGGYALYEWSK